MTLIMLKEKPYIRIVDEANPGHTTRLKLSKESWERYKEWESDKKSSIPVAEDLVMWACENCGEKIIVGSGWERRSVHDAKVQYDFQCCEEMHYVPSDRQEFGVKADLT